MDKQMFKKLALGMLETNCFLVPIAQSGTLYIIDPGAEADKIINAARSMDFDRAEILLTHGHVDHISAAGELALALGIEKVRLHRDDHALYKSPDNHLLPYVPPAVRLPQATDEFEGDDYEVIHTPGHTPGGVCFYFKSMPVLFCGDTIFAGSIGRTDFPGGNLDVLLSSIREKIMTLPDDLVMMPGHGAETTVGSEKISNPFF
jgi:glyoxylase-like metal-dependent hydrolase (beta-lactamase superfamily II)